MTNEQETATEYSLSLKAEVLKALREAEGPVSGQELCLRFGKSRTAIWKAVTGLQEAGYEIDAKQNQGYTLLSQPDLLTKEEMESRLSTAWAGRNAICKATTGSTNADAKKLAEEGAPHGTLVTSDEQTMGRGRRGRAWNSPAGTSISFSLVLRPPFEPDKAPMLTLLIGLAAAEATEEMTGLPAQIKWPNDVVVGGSKISGILTEMSAEPGYIHYVVVGVGINVNVEQFPAELDGIASSLYLEAKKQGVAQGPAALPDGRFLRGMIIAETLRWFEGYYERYVQAGSLLAVREEYNRKLAGLNGPVRVLDPAGEFDGISRGIDENGDLLVEKENGEIVPVYAGEVSVRGLYGYVPG